MKKTINTVYIKYYTYTKNQHGKRFYIKKEGFVGSEQIWKLIMEENNKVVFLDQRTGREITAFCVFLNLMAFLKKQVKRHEKIMGANKQMYGKTEKKMIMYNCPEFHEQSLITGREIYKKFSEIFKKDVSLKK